jgi:ketosteroid isomerase-like protein
MHASPDVRVVLEVLAAIEQRDAARFLALTHSEVTICWPPSLPGTPGYPAGPTKRATTRVPGLGAWAPLQPTAAERQMHPEVIAAADDRVVVRWHQRGRSPAGAVLDDQVLGLYELRQERLAHAQMLYFDPDAVKRFLADAAGQRPGRRPPGPPVPGR